MVNTQRDTDSYFQGILDNIKIILNNKFYYDNDKKNLQFVKLEIEKWYMLYKEKNTLKGIEPNTLKNIELEVTDFFDKYVISEPVKKNYSERILYDFGCLEKIWKKEMLEGKINE